MKTVTSVSGGRTSAYIAANYQSDYLLFALVRIEDDRCRFKDEKIRLEVEDRIQKPFIATAEDDMIILEGKVKKNQSKIKLIGIS